MGRGESAGACEAGEDVGCCPDFRRHGGAQGSGGGRRFGAGDGVGHEGKDLNQHRTSGGVIDLQQGRAVSGIYMGDGQGGFVMTMTRRQFARRGTMSMVGAGMLRGVPLLGQPGERRVGYAMIGLGGIAKHFGGGVKESQSSKITGLVSGDRAKAEQWAQEYGVPKDAIYSYEDMDRMRDNKAIDAVYVALPNSMHAEYTERSAKAGKHVLCEKPMSTTVDDAKRMIAACEQARVKLMIAYRVQYEPLTLEVIQRLRAGEIGQIIGIESANGFGIGPNQWRLDGKLAGGGPLMDVGIYSLNATRYLTGEEPVEFKATTFTHKEDPRFREVEETVAWTTRFPSGVLAACNTTYGGGMKGFLRVTGSKGAIEMLPAFDYDGIKVRVTKPGVAPEEKTNPEKDPAQFARQADYFSMCVLQKREPKTNGQEGLRDMEHMSRIYQAAGLRAL